ncbi:MAG: SDR family NAD(P)-dependent oxidoreductase, partial [Steroidobacteraceae bacterium]
MTGAGRGIGAAIARALASQGAQVSLLGRSRDSLDKLAAELNANAETCVAVADVKDGSALQAAFARARERFGP